MELPILKEKHSICAGFCSRVVVASVCLINVLDGLMLTFSGRFCCRRHAKAMRAGGGMSRSSVRNASAGLPVRVCEIRPRSSAQMGQPFTVVQFLENHVWLVLLLRHRRVDTALFVFVYF